MTKEPAEDDALFLRHGISADDAELREDLSFMFADMRKQAEIVRRLPLQAPDEPALIFVWKCQIP